MQNPQALSYSLDDFSVVRPWVVYDIFKDVTILHPRADHVRVRSVVEARTPEREEVLALVDLPHLAPDLDFAYEALRVRIKSYERLELSETCCGAHPFHLWCYLDPADDLDRAPLVVEVLAFVDVEAGAARDRVSMEFSDFAVFEFEFRKKLSGRALDPVQVVRESKVVVVSYRIPTHELKEQAVS